VTVTSGPMTQRFKDVAKLSERYFNPPDIFQVFLKRFSKLLLLILDSTRYLNIDQDQGVANYKTGTVFFSRPRNPIIKHTCISPNLHLV